MADDTLASGEGGKIIQQSKTIQYVDSHAHLTSPEIYPLIHEVLPRARETGVRAVVNICTDPENLKKGLLLSNEFSWIYHAAATTPHDVEKEGDLSFPFIADCARKGLLAAVGETGLDYYHHHSPITTQKKFLVKYLQLALECSLPVVIHCREAFSDFFEILDANYAIQGKHAPGVLHCFTGTLKEAHQVLERGWFLSLSGIVTFKKSEGLRDVARMVPLNQLLIETDTPYLAPQSRRGKVNEPAFLPETAAVIAEVKGVSLQEVAAATAANACQLFSFHME
jgi:TatD DNase family protein